MIATRLRRAAGLVLLLLCACGGPRADIDPVGNVPETSEVVEILVGTTRARTAEGTYAPHQRAPLSFLRVDVAIPEEHRPGLIETARGGEDPSRRFTTVALRPFAGAGAFRAEVARQLRNRPDAKGEVFVYVHGFNNTMGDSVFRAAQIANDVGLDAVPVHYAWPSRGNALKYAYDRDSALFARRGLVSLLDELARAGATSIVLVAHSMGSQLTMETLRQMAMEGGHPSWNRLGGVALMSPDIDLDVFRTQAQDIGALPQPFFVVTSNRDKVLRLSARLTGQRNRLGNVDAADALSDLDVKLVDVSGFRDTKNVHLTAVTSPTFLAMLNNMDTINRAFQASDTVRPGLISGTVLTVQDATEALMAPVEATTDALTGTVD